MINKGQTSVRQSIIDLKIKNRKDAKYGTIESKN